MIVFTRRENQGVVLSVGGVRVTVRVAEIKGGKARLVIDAPGTVQVNRGEIQATLDAIAAERLNDSKAQ